MSGVSRDFPVQLAKMSRGCYEETATVVFKLYPWVEINCRKRKWPKTGSLSLLPCTPASGVGSYERRRAVTSKKPTTCTHPSDAISHSLIHHRSYRVNSDIAVTLWCVSECVCPRSKRNLSNYQHQTWYTHTLWSGLGVHWPWGQKVKGQRSRSRGYQMRYRRRYAGRYDCFSFSLSELYGILS